jgi:hypothetical protein
VWLNVYAMFFIFSIDQDHGSVGARLPSRISSGCKIWTTNNGDDIGSTGGNCGRRDRLI